jgi:hypothetical protein
MTFNCSKLIGMSYPQLVAIDGNSSQISSSMQGSGFHFDVDSASPADFLSAASLGIAFPLGLAGIVCSVTPVCSSAPGALATGAAAAPS